MIDSHCHLDHPPLFDNLKDVVERAQTSGVKRLLTISTSLKSFETIKKIVLKYDNIYGTLGIHPHETEDHKHVDKEMLIELKNKNKKIIGIGETGLDFFYDNSDRIIQKKKFENIFFTKARRNPSKKGLVHFKKGCSVFKCIL